MKWIGNNELNKRAEKFANQRCKPDESDWMNLRGAFRAGAFEMYKFLNNENQEE